MVGGNSRAKLPAEDESPEPTPVRAEEVSAEEVRAGLDRLLGSRVFARSERLARFLRYTVEQALAGNNGQIKEYLLGVQVFDRKPDYDPRIDPIVRVEARRLRNKLRVYYSSAGRNDPVVIEYPKGSYTAVFRARRTRKTAAPAPAVTETPAKDAPYAIAVLPFADLTPQSTDTCFSDGLTEDLLHLLTRVEGLRVVAWHSAAKLRGQERDMRAVRDQLQVTAVLQGAVRQSENRVRVTAQVVDTKTGDVLWSEAYDRALRDVFAIQEEIARSIVETLRPALGWAPAFELPRPAPDLEYYNLCLQARYHAHKRTGEGLRKSAIGYQAAIARDSQCALAHAGLADAYSLLCDYGLMHPQEAMPKAEAAALQALALDPRSSEALVALAFVRSVLDWHWAEAEALYRQAIAQQPSYAQARQWFSVDLLALLGRFDEALAEIQAARLLDPLSLIIHECYAYQYMLRRDYDAALSAVQQALKLDAQFGKFHAAMGRTLSLMGRYQEAIAAFENARAASGEAPSLIAALGETRARAGNPQAARQALRKLRALAATRYVPATSFAILHLGLGETGPCLDRLEEATDRREVNIRTIGVHPLYDPLRSEPRFRALLARLGLR